MHGWKRSIHDRYVSAIAKVLASSDDPRKIALAGLRALDINPPPSAREAQRRRNKQQHVAEQHAQA
jgi:hypothetical protein